MTAWRSVTVLAALLVPWTVLVVPGADWFGVHLVFAWGLLDPASLHVVSITAYVFEHTAGLPGHLLAWPTSVLIYGLAVASVLGGDVFDREDRRLTAGFLAVAGLSHLRFATGVGTSGGPFVVPVATAVLWYLAWRSRPATLYRYGSSSP